MQQDDTYIKSFAEFEFDINQTFEIEICNKKLKYWGRMITNQQLVDNKLQELKKIWNV
jgi:hypothetical protein